MYRYAEIEAALAKIHGVAPSAMGAFKGRIIHYQRIGIAPPSPGRGKKIEYTFQDAAVWAFCLQLSEFGIDPTVTKSILDACYNGVLPIIENGHEGEDQIFYFYPNLMSRWFKNEAGNLMFELTLGIVDASETSIERLSTLMSAPGVEQDDVGRVAMINLSLIHRKLMASLPLAT